jgi:hypothetical protein
MGWIKIDKEYNYTAPDKTVYYFIVDRAFVTRDEFAYEFGMDKGVYKGNYYIEEMEVSKLWHLNEDGSDEVILKGKEEEKILDLIYESKIPERILDEYEASHELTPYNEEER